MIALSGADIVLPDRILHGGSLVIDQGRIAAVEPRAIDAHAAGLTVTDFSNHVIVPGFVDVHIHGVDGIDVLDGPDAVVAVAHRLPRYGVTAFCPTSVACSPQKLTLLLTAIARARSVPARAAARVLPAHLESNFINPEWNGAQPAACLRIAGGAGAHGAEFRASDILAVIASHPSQVGIVTLAPELPGGIELVRDLVARGHRVSIGHSGATYDEARAAIELGAHHATHLFNRMSSITSRSPGVVGAVLEADAVAAEIICDGHHVHPSLVSMAIRLKSASRIMAITDATAVAGLPRGAQARLGDQVIFAGERTAILADGTLAGSILTMDGAFRNLVSRIGVSLPDAARMCATTPAAAAGMDEIGAIAAGKWADLAIFSRDLRIRQTYLAGEPALEP